MAEVPKQIAELIAKFDQHLDAYHAATYGETEVRVEFINPFFEALGWDVANRTGYAEAYKDVIHEDAIKIGGATKAPDYCFRIGGTRKFFLEAKKPATNIKGDTNPAFQLRRYAWSAKLPLSILTDFEEFAVYDCRIKPDQADRASTARVLYLTYSEYVRRWDEIAAIFSRDAVLKGSFDRYAESSRGKKGTAAVDAAFLKEIEAWRESLARNLALRNPDLTQQELNFAVQRTIDRIIFLRMCEDRGIEPYGQLQTLLNGEHTYERLRYLYGIADDRYNSGLFHFKPEKGRAEAPDALAYTLTIDDKVLKEIIRRLYYPESPYEFSVLGADILGNVYEQFLGKVIRLTPGHRAVVEDKPEVKKAGGVYYTPAYIVDYIVTHTVGKLCEGKTPKQVAKLRILDPACGSGSFLISAYSSLLNYHRDWYVKDDPKRHTKEIYQGIGGQWFLTTQEKKRILLNNIYGVDIDSQAVEVTKLSLLLKVLEGENQDSLTRQLQMWRERALPDLGNNIKCGNSLIGPDFYEHQQMSLLDEDERYHINVFDWQAEFPSIMQAGGFDAVIGNPPYVRQEGVSDYKHYFSVSYNAYHGLADLYVYFYERGLQLARDGGLLGYISSSKFLHTGYGTGLRDLLSQHLRPLSVVDYGDVQIFKGATTYPIVVIGEKTHGSVARDFRYGRAASETGVLPETILDYGKSVSCKSLTSGPWIFTTKRGQRIVTKMTDQSSPLSQVGGPAQIGIKTSLNEAFVVKPDVAHALVRSHSGAREVLKPYGRGRDIRNWFSTTNGDFLICARESLNIENYPSVKEYLKQFEARLRARYEVQRGDYDWWVIRQVANTEVYDNPKLVYPDLCSKSRFALNVDGMYPNNTVFCIPSDSLALLGYLNSQLAWYWITQHCPANRGDAYRLSNQHMNKLPVNPSLLRHTRLSGLVEQMLGLHKQLAAAKTPDEKTRLHRQIGATDRLIDQLVYDLYGLTEEEVRLVEEATTGQRVASINRKVHKQAIQTDQ
ncbi:MAG: restriction endonuclease subunit M [Candidatus Methylomirabilota bacterium]|nr:restriction endonuclease subunit M [candidate division NC10 bacterium]PWB45963.1 MAG: restriction endonuclease subunit M [candidate division NC10 bacterium]